MTDFEGNLINQKNNIYNSFGIYFTNNEFIRSTTVNRLMVITRVEYEALSTPNPYILYLIIED